MVPHNNDSKKSASDLTLAPYTYTVFCGRQQEGTVFSRKISVLEVSSVMHICKCYFFILYDIDRSAKLNVCFEKDLVQKEVFKDRH